MRKAGIYIHIPFCKKKCDYCDFISFCNKDKLIPEYIKYLRTEIEDVSKNLKEAEQEFEITTIYIGGGTPSYISPLYIQEIMNTVKEGYRLNKDIEITIEINPGTITEEKLLIYRNSGINRLSIGLQVVQDSLLKQLGRIHTYEEFEQTFNLAKKSGFTNINVDLMIGLPNQTLDDVKASLEKILSLDPEHVSIYSLIVEEGTKLSQDIESKKLLLPSEDLERDMYKLVKNTLEKNKYIHYEISNFAKKGKESKHNLSTWNQEEYFGFGVAAHSFMDDIRFSNTDDIELYIQNYKGNDPNSNFVFHEKLDYLSKMKEYVMLSFRKVEGVNKKSFKENFELDIYSIFSNELTRLIKEELIIEQNDYIRLTDKGLDLANQVFKEFI